MVHLDKILIKSLLAMDRMPGSVLVAKDTAVNMTSRIPAFTGLHPSKGTEIREAKHTGKPNKRKPGVISALKGWWLL